MTIIEQSSPNFNDRAAPISALVLHYTGMKSGVAAIERLCDPVSEVSSHYVVEEDGRVFRLVSEDKRAWHAGRSHWSGTEDLNSISIGIEIVNPGHEFGYRSFAAAQMSAVAALCRDIIARHKIPAQNVLAHSDIAPARKEDPGELFDWKMLAGQGVGLWPSVIDADRAKGEAYLSDEARLREALTRYGYDPRVSTDILLRAFQRHFHQEVFSKPDSIGVISVETGGRLASLLRLKSQK